MLRSVRGVCSDNKGLANLEYALIGGLIFSAVLNATHVFAPKLITAFGNIGTTLVKHAAGT